ncbi:Hypothetical protein ORPV_805 [Orpheovirus IHUMI-LCC2]|uniref:Uncharacterized protein n=1 Tax=Orpheovirus IHUMI-LCC2 TaxID=2023057 RepID=A0A2I2L5H6_9VIRU|nr:Hypothetical protein ORPV_805 [Orpheovirus IHUMI-LCC2]SNW62709.1 Hypothetical protein ORPV_805 [Orpheovirus IHUMI-LCC2]
MSAWIIIIIILGSIIFISFIIVIIYLYNRNTTNTTNTSSTSSTSSSTSTTSTKSRKLPSNLYTKPKSVNTTITPTPQTNTILKLDNISNIISSPSSSLLIDITPLSDINFTNNIPEISVSKIEDSLPDLINVTPAPKLPEIKKKYAIIGERVEKCEEMTEDGRRVVQDNFGYCRIQDGEKCYSDTECIGDGVRLCKPDLVGPKICTVISYESILSESIENRVVPVSSLPEHVVNIKNIECISDNDCGYGQICRGPLLLSRNSLSISYEILQDDVVDIIQVYTNQGGLSRTVRFMLSSNGYTINQDSDLKKRTNKVISSFVVFGGQIICLGMGPDVGKVFGINIGDAVNNRMWELVEQEWAPSNAIHLSATIKGDYLWIQTGMEGFLYQCGANGENITYTKLGSNNIDDGIRVYGSDINHYLKILNSPDINGVQIYLNPGNIPLYDYRLAILDNNNNVVGLQQNVSLGINWLKYVGDMVYYRSKRICINPTNIISLP